ncbi:SDR family NAD(P)-dependent oxidoreductase [Prauserella sp. PE36]|uniref:SDR family NAD(P)-dependent oxidoreductase n=1 Tax=Prauserella sp. PE36 TaxID=1504709 RepID=UPI0018F514BF|nr:SDR family NAD(P)-dependent oxidoreductase [Prauserella sp. PE36]
MTERQSVRQRDPHLLEGQVALVTGASSGLGERFARVLAAAGAKVALAARRTDRIEAVCADITAAGGTAVGVRLDLTKPETFAATVDEAQDKLGPVTTLVNNAGVPYGVRPHKVSAADADLVIGTNLRGPFLLSCEVGGRMIADGRPGRIVNVSSMTAFHYSGTPTAALYSVTKAALARMTEVLAVEWARNRINVVGMAPGMFHSEMMAGMISRVGDPSDQLPRGRLPEPSLLDSTLLYLTSPASEAVTGTVIKVDDGQFGR